MSACELAGAIGRRDLSPLEAVDAVLAQMDRVNPELNAVVTRCDEMARERARSLEQAIMAGADLGPLHGVPLTVKDLEETQGIRTTFGSRLYEKHVPQSNHLMVQRLLDAGAIIVGKTNSPEFGLLSVTDNALFGPTKNPWNLAHNAGGSSGGSAAAVATGIAPLATGSDGGGSIRTPSAFCGVFGIKPHHGRAANLHVPPGWESLSSVGPIARSVRDAARMLDVITGPHPQDRWSLPDTGVRFEPACGEDIKGMRLAWSPDFGRIPVDPQVREACREAVRRFEKLGCEVEEVPFELEDLGWIITTIVVCETVTAMEDQREEWERVMFQPLRGMLALEDTLSYRDLQRAHWKREELTQDFARIFKDYDALLTPQMPVTAPELGVLNLESVDGQPINPIDFIGFTFPFNLTGQPAASLPVGFDREGLPIGLQIAGRRFGETGVLRLAAAYESAHPWGERRPTLAT